MPQPMTRKEEDVLLEASEAAAQVGMSAWWLNQQVRKGLVPHVRIGLEPVEGRRDTRPIRFTRANVDAIKAMLVQHVPARDDSGAA